MKIATEENQEEPKEDKHDQDHELKGTIMNYKLRSRR